MAERATDSNGLRGMMVVCACMVAAVAVTEAAEGHAQKDPLGVSESEEITAVTAQWEAAGAVIGKIIIIRQDVFDTSNPKENKSIFRAANRWHIETREAVIRKQLLFKEGDTYSRMLLDESERILRRNVYLFDADISATGLADGQVEVTVRTRDVWTLTPEFSVTRSGGENTTEFGLEELNLAGTGSRLALNHEENVDRDSTSLAFSNRHLGRHWLALDLSLADSSDGNTSFLRLQRPFYALDTRRAAGITLLDDDRVDSFYELGQRVAEYRRERTLASAFYGWSRGRQNGWVRRWSVGLTYDDTRFGVPRTPTLPSVIPADRELVYPFVRFDLLEDKFSETHNLDSIEKTEDVYLGTSINMQLGWASERFGADRDAAIVELGISKGSGSPARQLLLLDAALSGRWEGGQARNGVLRGNARYFLRQSPKRSFSISLSAATTRRPDLDTLIELGGDSGLRGYPLRYQRGKSRALITLEQRYYTDWYPFRILRVGGAVFADIGRTWGDNPVGADGSEWLRDVGFGLRLVPTRGSPGKVYHIDIAFPLDGDASIDTVQLILEGKRSF